jgi:hypothetical protein
MLAFALVLLPLADGILANRSWTSHSSSLRSSSTTDGTLSQSIPQLFVLGFIIAFIAIVLCCVPEWELGHRIHPFLQS